MQTPVPLSEVSEPWWDDSPAIIVGGGPSLKGFDFSQLEGLGHVIAVNSSYHDLPFADLIFSADLGFMKRHRTALANHGTPVVFGVPIAEGEYQFDVIPGATYIRRDRVEGTLSLDPAVIQTSGNSGLAAFNYAVLKKPKVIFCFGLDFTSDHYAPERYTHQPRDHNARYYPRWALNFEPTAPVLEKLGISVVNASPQSNLTVFPRCTTARGVELLQGIRNGNNPDLRSP